ncbi:MAG TPA: class I SAM-dependent methyltransferase [Thermoanaerobaculia bacterium]|nr:class I SAM-dependent methyltransferase [Thermoanaerobaculia bacterium]
MTVWNDAHFTERLVHSNWMANTAVLMYLNERATGDPARDWLTVWGHRWFVGGHARVLVLGCGEGWLERTVATWPFVAHIDAVDFAADAVERARELGRGIGNIDYGVVDLNRDELPRDAYDVVIAHSVLHHVANLEHAYAQIERAMRADATLLINEYVGPNRFQFSDGVLAIMNALLQCVRPGASRVRPSVEEMIANDPTEAVRSEEIVGFTERTFEVCERRDLGGTILQHLLYEIAEELRFEVPRERALVELLCAIEAMLVDGGRIGSDFTLLAARKKGSRVAPSKRALPPRTEAANDIERDPLWRNGRRTSRPPSHGGRGRPPSSTHLRLLRVALLSAQAHRANLFHESNLAAFLERFRARGRDPWEWIIDRAPDDPAIRCLLRTAATLAPA